MHISLTILTRIHACIQKVFLTLRFVKYVHCVYNVVRQQNVHIKIYIIIYDVNILCIDIFLYLSFFFYLRKHIIIRPIFFVVAQLAKLRYSVYVYKRMQRLTTAATTVIEQSSSDFFSSKNAVPIKPMVETPDYFLLRAMTLGILCQLHELFSFSWI